MDKAPYDATVIGAGIVGACCALWLQMRGLNVLLIDRNPPGSGTSYGNACVIATYGCVPINDPALFRQLPSLLFAKDSPLSFDWHYAIRHMPWMLAFLRHCTPARVQAIIGHLGVLLRHSDTGLNPLIDIAGARDLIVDNDCLYVYTSQRLFNCANDSTEVRRRNGSAITVLDANAIRALEPTLKLPIYKGLYHHGARHVRNPQALVECFVERFTNDGGKWRNQQVIKTTPAGDGVVLTLQNGETVSTRLCVIAAGAHAKSIAGCGAAQTPLDTERGYHIQYTQHSDLLNRPVGWAEAGFYATPTSTGLRIAGTVEIAGLQKPKNPHRIDYLKRMSHAMFGNLGQPQQDWIGFRPTTPDALPVIGPSPVSGNILFAYGHQHLGLTLGGITGKIIGDIACGTPTDIAISAYSPNRFRHWAH